MRFFGLERRLKRSPSAEFLAELHQANKMQPAPAQTHAQKACDTYFATTSADEARTLQLGQRIFKRVAGAPSPDLGLARLARGPIDRRLTTDSARYRAAIALPVLDAMMGELIEAGCDDDDTADADDDVSWDRLTALMGDSLTRERFALTHAEALSLNTLQALPEIPLASAELRVTELMRELEIGGLLGMSPTVSPEKRRRFAAVASLFIAYVPNFLEKLSLLPRHLLDDGASAPAAAVHLIATHLSAEEVEACQRFAGSPEAAEYLRARPSLLAVWQQLQRSGLVKAAYGLSRQPDAWNAAG